jgi:hypothetical protein
MAYTNMTLKIGIVNLTMTKHGTTYALSSKRHIDVTSDWEQRPPAKEYMPHKIIFPVSL